MRVRLVKEKGVFVPYHHEFADLLEETCYCKKGYSEEDVNNNG